MRKEKIKFAVPKTTLAFKKIWSSQAEEKAKKLGFQVEFVEKKEDWETFLADADGVITSWISPCFDAELLDKCPNLKIIGHAAGAVADFVTEDTFKRGVKVSTSNSLMAKAVAEWSAMMTLIGQKKVLNYMTSDGSLVNWDLANNSFGTLRNSVVGIWGYGAIANQLIPMLKPFAPKKILVNSSHLSSQQAAELGVEIATLEEVFAQSDVIHLLTGLNDRTANRIDEKLLSSIKDGGCLINAGRAALIEENALYNEAKKERILIILDVLHKEPMEENSPLIGLKNLIITPHCAGHSSQVLYAVNILEEFANFFDGKPLLCETQLEQLAFMTSHQKVEQLSKK